MAIIREITIDGREVPFKASAAVPRVYRAKFGRDIFKDMQLLVNNINAKKAQTKAAEGEEADEGLNVFDLDVNCLEMFENIAYTMAKHADPTVPNTADEWLDGFDTFSIYMILPEIIALWGLNVQTDVESKKNLNRLTDR